MDPKMKKNLHYFSKGFTLANRSLDLLLIGVFILSVSHYIGETQRRVHSVPLDLLGLVLVFFSFGFFMSLPIFLVWKQSNKFSYLVLGKTVLKNTKRMILPGLLLLALLSISVVTLYLSLASGHSAAVHKKIFE